jgi:diguanylate cyclase (GGDEF)-like protein
MDMKDKLSVLLVDDERSNLAVLNRILSPEYTVLTSKSGEEAISRAQKDAPDLILLDIMMPGMDGFETLTKLKDTPEAKDIPVIIVTGLSSEEDEERGFALGAVDYITKPFRSAIVQARVRTHMQIVRQMRTIEMLGLTDSLTGIANRRSFDSHLEREWRRCIRDESPISFLMMDLDKFKNYNDTYGHQQGDLLLKTVAQIFAAETRRPSDLAARLGGEEFGVLLPGTEMEGAIRIAENIRSNVEAARVLTDDGRLTSITISIGVSSVVPQRGDSATAFTAKADEYLYVAKNSGRNRIYTGPESQ